MIRTITIPDLHGKDIWKKVNPEDFDRMIFVGDYVDAPYKKSNDLRHLRDQLVITSDTEGKTDGEILYNLNEIILLKEKYPEKVILLLGNHDIPYIYYKRNPSKYQEVLCTGHRESMLEELSRLFNDNFDKFQLMYQIKDVVWSHAGLTQSAYDEYYKSKFNGRFDILVEEMNKLFILNMDENLHNISHFRRGRERYGSVLWADIREWDMNMYSLPFNQIVGHHPVDDITVDYSQNEFIQPPRFIVHTDVLKTKTKFFQHDIGE